MSYEQQYYDALKRISRYMTPEQIRRAGAGGPLNYVEYLEMCYENVLEDAKHQIKGRRRPKVKRV